MALAVVSMIALSGCSFVEQQNPEPEATETTPDGESLGDGVNQFVDEEAGVVCYKFTGYEKGGISCVPINQTDLAE